MTNLYLERIGLIRPTIVKRNNNGEIERLESIGLDIASLVAFWRKCFDLNEPLFEKIILHCKSKDFNAMGQRTLATRRSVRELLAEQGVECVIDDEWFENREVKSENERIAVKRAIKEFAGKLTDYVNNKVMEDFDDSESVKYYTIDLDEFESKIDELLKDYEK